MHIAAFSDSPHRHPIRPSPDLPVPGGSEDGRQTSLNTLPSTMQQSVIYPEESGNTNASSISDPSPFSIAGPDDLVILPTALLADRWRQSLIRSGILHNPDLITTLEGFCRFFHDASGGCTRIIPEAEALIILSRTLEEIRDEIPSFFRGSGPSSATVRDLYELRSILSQRSVDLSSHHITGSSEKCRQIDRALAAFEKALEAKNLLDMPALVGWTTRTLRAGDRLLFGTVRLIRLYEIFPREQTLITAIRSRSRAMTFESVNGADPVLFSAPGWIHPAERRVLPAMESFTGRSDLFTDRPDPQPRDPLPIQVFPTETDEFEAVAEEIHALAEEGIPLEEIAIASPQISSASAALQNVLSDFGIPFYLHPGEPLLREPLAGFLISFLTLALNEYPREGVLSLLSSPFLNRDQGLDPLSPGDLDRVVRTAGIVGGYAWDRQIAALNERVRTNHADQFISPAVIEVAASWISALLEDLHRFTGEHTPAEYAAISRAVFTRWVSPGVREILPNAEDIALIRENRVFHAVMGCITRICSIPGMEDPVPLSRYHRYLLSLLEEPVHLSPDTGGVRIMGFRQICGMEYTCVFLPGLVEGDLPRPSTRLPLLTSYESEELGARNLDEVITGEQYYFVSALGSGRRVWLSSPRTRGEKTVLTSSFLERVRTVKSPVPWGREICHSRRNAFIRAGSLIGSHEGGNLHPSGDLLIWLPTEHTCGSIEDRIRIETFFRSGREESVYEGVLSGEEDLVSWLSGPGPFGDDHVWSPTRLEIYADCPFRFFLEHLIRVRPLPDGDETLSPARKGSLIHETLAAFFCSWCAEGPRRITSSDIPAASALMRDVFTTCCRTGQNSSPAWDAMVIQLIGSDLIPGILDRFILFESERDTPLVPTLFEYPLGGNRDNTPGPGGFVTLGDGPGMPVRIQGTIDRVDITPDGFFFIIDYKTGSLQHRTRDITEGKALQLPLYLLALEVMHRSDPVPLVGSGGSYLNLGLRIRQKWPLLDPAMKDLVGSSRKPEIDDFRGVLKDCLDATRRHITGIRCGRFPVTHGICSSSRFCPYSGICRSDSFRIPGEEPGEEE